MVLYVPYLPALPRSWWAPGTRPPSAFPTKLRRRCARWARRRLMACPSGRAMPWWEPLGTVGGMWDDDDEDDDDDYDDDGDDDDDDDDCYYCHFFFWLL